MEFVTCADCVRKHLRAALGLSYLHMHGSRRQDHDFVNVSNTKSVIAAAVILISEAAVCKESYQGHRDAGLGLLAYAEAMMCVPEDATCLREARLAIDMANDPPAVVLARFLTVNAVIAGHILCAQAESPVPLDIPDCFTMADFVENFETYMRQIEKEGGE